MAQTAQTAQIVNLDELVPRSMVFQLHGEEWILPGDIDVETTFRFQQLLLDLGAAEDETLAAQLAVLDTEVANGAGMRQREALDRQAKITLEMEQEVLALFKVNHPELERLPFGSAGFRAVLAHVLMRLGFGVEGEESEEKNPTTKRGTEKMAPVKSKPSRTSSARSKSSA